MLASNRSNPTGKQRNKSFRPWNEQTRRAEKWIAPLENTNDQCPDDLHKITSLTTRLNHQLSYEIIVEVKIRR